VGGSTSYAGMGMIKIQVNPAPASITIDGQKQKEATLDWQVYELSPGSHTIRAEKEFFIP
jgi:hypothetical protein